MEFAPLLLSLASVLVIAFAWWRLLGLPLRKGLLSAGFGLVALAGASALIGWAGTDSSRLGVVVVVVIALGAFTIVKARKQEPTRRPPMDPPEGRIDFF
jgi:hypothetical protein